MSKHCRYVAKRDVPHPQAKDKTIQMSCIPEGDVYRLAAHSKLPGAEEFESWIFDEVLPSIREHGSYSLIPKDLPSALRAYADELERNKQLEQENAAQRMMLAEASPKVSYYDLVLQTPDVISVSKIAKDYGKSPQWLNNYLNELGVQYRQGRLWLLYQKYAEQGYTKTKTALTSDPYGKQHSTLHTYWTQKGRLFIYDLLKQNGILPTIERDLTA